MEKFNYVTTTKADLSKLNKELANEGMQLYNIDGDSVCSAVVGLVENEILLECDLMYGHHDGCGFGHVDKQALEEWKPQDWSFRLFKFGLISKPNSPFGFLPNYRFWMMDPQSFGAMKFDPPAGDGSYCRKMANSLRHVLQLEYKTVIGVHFKQTNRENFRKNINAAWNWLDGKSLLQ